MSTESTPTEKYAGHTPGPWEKKGGLTPHYTCVVSGDTYIVFAMADRRFDNERSGPILAPDMEAQAANARLIADAPKLLAERDRLRAVLKDAIGWMRRLEDSQAVPHPDLTDTINATAAALNGARDDE